MLIEQKIFSRKRFRTDKLAEYGFVNKEACCVLSKEIMNGEFTAEIRVYESGMAAGRVLDNFSGEEYVLLRLENAAGAYVGAVREAYEVLLRDIADKCCDDVAFISDQSNRIADAIYERYSVTPDFPWSDGNYRAAGTFRHSGNNKWFGLLMNIDRRHLDKNSDSEMVEIINLKADEDRTAELHRIPGIYPAYHMNHSKWISVLLNDTLSDDEVMDLVGRSFILTQPAGGVINESLVREVLDIADKIPRGRVMSYGQIARVIGRPNNSRLVGRIMSMADRYGEHPCHRVVNHAGRTVPGWREQRSMLESEGVEFRANGNVDMDKFRYEPET